MTTIESLERKLNGLTARLDSRSYKQYIKYQENIADQYDGCDDKQMFSYYRALIRKAEDLVYEGNFDDIDDNSYMDSYINQILK